MPKRKDTCCLEECVNAALPEQLAVGESSQSLRLYCCQEHREVNELRLFRKWARQKHESEPREIDSQMRPGARRKGKSMMELERDA